MYKFYNKLTWIIKGLPESDAANFCSKIIEPMLSYLDALEIYVNKK